MADTPPPASSMPSLGVSNPLVPPLYQSSVYTLPDLDALDKIMNDEQPGFIYARDGHPNARFLADQLARHEEATWAIICGSGMAAITAGLLAIVQQGDRIVASNSLYGRTTQLLGKELERYGIQTTFVAAREPSCVRAALDKPAKIVLVETMSNPLLCVADIDALVEIASQDTTPIIVGGTGQYVWALLEGWRVPRVAPNRELRAELEALAEREGPATIVAMLREIDALSAERIDAQNVRRLIRAIEVTRETGIAFSEWQQKSPPTEAATIIGLELGRDELYRRIDARVDAMIAGGLVAEVQGLVGRGYGCDLPAMNSIGYRQICEYLRGECTLDVAVERIKTETHRLARMQHTWFRRDDERITWLDAGAPDLVERALAVVSAAA